jgi:chlorobactene glucosyltransferase
MEWLWWMYHLTILAVLLVTLATLIGNLFVIPVLREEQPAEVQPLVSILVPARNEESRIRPCLQSLLQQNYSNLEIIILDDRSEDATAELVRAWQGPNLRLIEGEPLPQGWIGKSWACHQLASLAKGDLLLFTDADTIHSPGTISAAVRQQQRSQASLLTLWPYQITRTWSEKLVIPLLYVVACGFIPHWFLGCCQRSRWLADRFPQNWMRALGSANGQFLLFRREVYDRIGGHAQIRNHLVEDVALGREVAARTAEGLKLISCDGARLMQCRMYRSFGELWEGFTKNLRPVFDGNTIGFCFAILWQAAVMVAPFLAILVQPAPMVIAEVGIIYLIRIVAAVRFRTSWTGLLLHPIGYALALAIALHSLIKTRGAGVTWKGRLYGKGD